MADDFGGGLAAPLDISASAVNAMPDNSAPALDNSGTLPAKMPQPQGNPIQQFGSSLAKMLPGPHYTSLPPGAPALDQAENQLKQQVDRASQVAANPIAQLFAPEQVRAARNFVPKAAEQLRTIAQQKQQQVDIQKSATNFGMPQSAQNPFMTNDTIDNWLLDQYKAGDFSKANMLKARGKGDWVQDFAGQAVDGAGAKLAAANGVITKLNAAGGNQPAYVATLRSLTPQERQSITSLGLQTIPEKASDWQDVVQQHGAAFMQAQQLHSQVSQKLANITNFDGTVPKDVESASQGDIRIGSSNEPAGFPVRTRSIDGQTGHVGPNGSVQMEKYGLTPKVGGWNVTNPDRLAKNDKMLAGDDVKGAINQYNIANKFKNEAMNLGMYSSSAGLALLKDTLGGVGRDVAEKSAAAGTTGLSQMFSNQMGGVEGFINRATSEIAAYKNWVDGGKKGDRPRMSDQTMRGLQFIANENYNYAQQQATGRLSGPMRDAGQIGRPLEDMPLDADLKASVAQYHEEGRVDAINGWRSYPSVVRGNQRIFFPQGSNVNGAGAPRPPLNADGSANGGSPLTPVQQAGQSANAPQPGGDASRPAPPLTPPSAGGGAGAPSQLDPSLTAAVKGFEGFTPKAQWDYKQRSNGYGTKAQSRDEVIDQPTAEARLTSELGRAQSQVDEFAPGLPPGARKALTSLTYNAGPGWMKAGLGDAVKSGDLDKAQSLLLTYNKAGGQENPGLTARRQQEASWFDQPAVPAVDLAAPTSLTPRQREALARRGIDTSAAPRGLTPEQQAAYSEQMAQQGRNMVGAAPAALGTIGALGGGALGGPPGAVAGGAAGSGAGQVLKDYVQGNAQSPAKIAEQAALGGVLGVASAARPVLAAAGRVVGSGAIEAGTKAAEGGSGPEIVDAGLRGAAEGLGGEALGRFVSSGGAAMYKAVSRYTAPAQQELMDHAGKLAAAREVLKTEQPKLPGDMGPNPKYEAAKKQADDATAAIKADHGQNPDDVVHAYEQATSGVSAGEAAVMRKAASEKAATSQGYNQLRQDARDAGVGVPKANQSVPDGPLAQIRTAENPTGAVEAKFAPDAQHAEMLIKAPAKDWSEKWQQLQNAGSELIQKRMAFLQNGDRPSADAMDGIFQGVRNQQKAAAEYVFGAKKGGEVISRLENLDQRYAKVMNATQGMDYGKMRSVIQAGNTPERRALEKNFTAFAGDDPSAMRAFNAMKAGAKGRLTDEAKLMVPLITAESLAHFGGIPTFGVISAAVGGHRLYKVMQQFMNAKVLGRPVKFRDFFNRELQSSGAGQAVRGAVQRGAVQGDALAGVSP
jgi:lysozyme